MLRVIGGTAKGRHLRFPSNRKIRPTSSKVRESVFNILTPYVKNAMFLDLFAGSGAVGIEALSRGASFAVFVESSSRCLSILKVNLELCGFSDRAEIYPADVMSFLSTHKQPTPGYDIVFVDPPYRYREWEGLLSKIIYGGIISNSGLLIVEHSSRIALPLIGKGPHKVYRYGDTALSVFHIRGHGREQEIVCHDSNISWNL